jgi:hypothetical protein
MSDDVINFSFVDTDNLKYEGDATRYYNFWTIEYFLIVSGDSSAWVYFSKAELEDTISQASNGNGADDEILKLAKTSAEETEHDLKVFFGDTKSNLLIGLKDLDKSDTVMIDEMI